MLTTSFDHIAWTQGLPELTQTSTASQDRRSYRPMFFDFFRDLRNGIVPFETVFGRSVSKKSLQNHRF